jgi:LmbE family N-acetylglucosaminyl deacetylase
MHVSLSYASRAFNPALRGTPNGTWENALECAPALSLPGGAIVVVSPHPDDEVLGAGGLIRSAALTGRDVTILSVTDGEAAYSDWQELALIRCREMREALRALGSFKVVNRHLRIPDGHVGDHRAVLVDAVERCISPGTLLVAPYERDGHPDHDTTGEVCCEIASACHLTLWRYPIWMWHHSTPDGCPAQSWGRFPLDAAAIKAKAEAMSCFASQMRPLGREPIVPSHVLPYFARPYEAYLT